MEWAFIIPTILLAALCVAVVIFSMRESYRNTLREIDSAAENLREIVAKHIDLYERTYALVFFFGSDSSSDKTQFSLPEDADMQELFDTSVKVDFEISLLCEKISASESLMKERGASVKKLYAELEEHESSLLSSASLYNERVASAIRHSSFKLSKYLLKGLGECEREQIVFEKE